MLLGKIPFVTDLSFDKSFGLFFTDKWLFMIKAVSTQTLPIKSKVIIDILQNGKETTATCLFIELNQKNLNLSCTSDFETQGNNDEIKINNIKKSGTVQWNLEQSVEISEQASQVTLSLDFIDAYDVYFNNKWVFTVKGKF